MDDHKFKQENIDPNYWRSYGYSHDPFMLTDQDNVYRPSTWEEYLDILPPFVRYCNSLLLVSGINGTGKTTLIKYFTREQLTGYEIIALQASECSGTEYLLQLLHHKFSAPYDASSTLPVSEQLTAQLAFLKNHKTPRLLVIDNAEQLPLDMRQACLQIIQQQSALETCLPVILIGTPQLNEQFNALLTPTTAKDCLHIMNIAPLTLTQTNDYLNWACKQANGDTELSPFTNEEVATLFQVTQGVIGKINQNARQLLASKQQPRVSWKYLLRGKFLWWGAIIIIIALLLYLYKYISQPSELAKTFTKPLVVRQQPLKPHPAVPAQSTEKHIGNMLVKEKKSPPPAKRIANPVKQPAIAVHPNKPVTTHHKHPAKANDLFNRVMQGKLLKHKQRVLKIKDSNYTLQLLATQNLHSAQKFIITHQLQTTAMIVQTLQKQKQWYIVLYGIFPTRQQAHTAIKDLHLPFKPSQFWIRSYKSIHQVMLANEKKR